MVFVLLLVWSSSCSKDILKSYDDRIIGNWSLSDVDKVGIGGNTSNLPFREGMFTFEESGGLVYENSSGSLYKGSWDISTKWIRDQCTTDDKGHSNCSSKQVRSMQVTAVDFNSQDVRSEHFDDIEFTSTNRFKARIYSGAHTYVFFFQRK